MYTTAILSMAASIPTISLFFICCPLGPHCGFDASGECVAECFDDVGAVGVHDDGGDECYGYYCSHDVNDCVCCHCLFHLLSGVRRLVFRW